jgi:hypothetical protein
MMNDEFLAAVREFGDAPRVLNRYDLGIALFLEYFAMPVLWFWSYVPLRRRRLLPELSVEFRDWISKYLPLDDRPDWDTLVDWAKTAIDGPAKQQEFLEMVGQSVHRRAQVRRLEIRQANLISALAFVCAILTHMVALLGVVVATWWLIPLWLITLLFIGTICRFDQHWKPKRK